MCTKVRSYASGLCYTAVIMWRFRKKRKRASSVTKHYANHKELARKLILERLQHHNEYYDFEYNRIAIRNQRRCWGSCTSLKNLNFSYKLLFLPEHLRDYIIVHELCHLAELNHGCNFWNLVAERVPDYKECVRELRSIEQKGTGVEHLLAVKESYRVSV